MDFFGDGEIFWKFFHNVSGHTDHLPELCDGPSVFIDSLVARIVVSSPQPVDVWAVGREIESHLT
jgi:hypothetical protein